MAGSTGVERSTLIAVTTAYAAVEQVRRALGGTIGLHRCATLAEARAALAECGPMRRIAGLLLQPRDARGAPTAPLVDEVRRFGGAREVVPVLALVGRSAPWCSATISLLEAHPATVLVEEDLDLRAVTRACVARLRRVALLNAVWGEVEADVPVGLRPLVRVALSRAEEPLTVAEIAASLGVHRKTLWSRCRRHGVGNVQALVTWCRLLAVEHALRNCSHSVDAIAEELAFASPTALRNAVRRHLGTTPSALREGRPGSAMRAARPRPTPSGPDTALAVAEHERTTTRPACDGFRAWLRGLRAPHGVTLGDVA